VTILAAAGVPSSSVERIAGCAFVPATAAGAIRRIALIGNFLPRRCGIATFTTHVHDALRARYHDVATDVYAMNDRGHVYDYPAAVVASIEQNDIASYKDAAATILRRDTDLIWVQHEFGIFGGPAGHHLLTILDSAPLPLILTLHTVLSEPSVEQRLVMERLLRRASLVVVMAQRAETILRSTYGERVGAVAVVPHGIPDRPYEEPALARRCRGWEDRPTIMTFGLLSPDKGIETMIRAMPTIVKACPDAVYRIVGATHPHVLAHEGESHRDWLRALGRSLGVADHLRWDNRFLQEAELLDQLAAADLYVTPYRNPAQITSGALAYAAGLGKPIISTPYVHAQELLGGGRGSLVLFDDAHALADAVIGLLRDPAARDAMAKRVRLHSRGAVWTTMVERIIETARRLVFDVPVTDVLAERDAQTRGVDLIAA